MKTKLLLAVLSCSLFFTMSGQTVNTSFAQDVNNKFSLLEKNRVPHHILLDYGFDIIDATKFDGVLRSDNYMTIGTFNQLFKNDCLLGHLHFSQRFEFPVGRKTGMGVPSKKRP